MGIRLAFICLLSFFLWGSASASETLYERDLARGIAALEAKSYTEATKAFSDALAEKPSDHTAVLYLGVAQSRAGGKEAESSLRKALSLSPEDPRTNLEMGIYYYGKGRASEAVGYFEKTSRLAPSSEAGFAAAEYLDVIRAVDMRKPWQINIWTGVQYDSNVVLGPDKSPLPQGISGKSDWRAIVYLDGTYRLVRRQGLECSAGYGLYQSLHSKLSDFNVTQSLFTVAASYQLSPSLKLGAAYLMEYALVGGNGYYGAHGVTPSLTISESDGLTTVIEYRYRRSHFIDSDLFQGNADRTGSNNSFGIMQTVRFGPRVSGRIGYAHDNDATRKDFWDYRGDRVFAGATINAVKDVSIDLSGEYYHKKYQGPDPLSETGERRKDDIYTAVVSISKRLSERFTISLVQQYTSNGSNVAAYDYKRSLTSLLLGARF